MILFTRCAYFVFTLLIWLFCFNVFRRILDWRTSLLIPLVFVLYAPCNLYNFSHHTLGMGFLSLSLFSGLLFLLNKKPFFFGLSGFFAILTSVAYPTLAFIFVLMPFIFLFSTKKIGSLLWYCVGLVTGTGVFLRFFHNLENVKASVAYTGSAEASTTTFDLARLIKVLISLWNSYPYKMVAIAVLLGIFYLQRFKKFEAKYFLLAVPLLPLWSKGFYVYPYTLSLGYVFFASLLAPYLFLFAPKNEQDRLVLISVWLPSFVAGIATAYTSGSGYLKAGVGSLPACVVSLFFLVRAFESLKINSNTRYLLIFLVLTISLVFFSFFQFWGFYREDNWRKLNFLVKEGIFKGIYTTNVKIRYLEGIEEDLKRVSKKAKTVFFYDMFPVGYFLTYLKPSGNTMWVYPKFSNSDIREDLVINYFKKRGRNPDVVVRVKKIFYSSDYSYNIFYPADHALNNYFVKDQKYKLVVSRKNYDILLREK